MQSLSAPDHDIEFAIVTDLEQLRQRIQQHLRFFRGEWFLDTTEGVPYLTDLLGDRLDTSLVESVLYSQILEVDGVVSVSNISVVEVRRTYRFTADVQTIYGDMRMESAVPSLS